VIWRYLGSTRNLVGCAGGLIGVLLYVVGVAGAYWPIVVAGLYVAGALIAAAERVRLVPADPTAAAGALRADLNTLLDKVTEHGGRMPGGSVEKVRRIGEVLDAILHRPAELAANPEVLHGVTRLARVDLPLSVQTYLNLPRWFAIGRGTGEATAAGELLAQLELLETDARHIADQFYSADPRQ
jgi:hypothetical protein